jgi:hypothetical protein
MFNMALRRAPRHDESVVYFEANSPDYRPEEVSHIFASIHGFVCLTHCRVTVRGHDVRLTEVAAICAGGYRR